MSDQEQLEMAKTRFEQRLKVYSEDLYQEEKLFLGSVQWLIEQVVRVQKLGEENERFRQALLQIAHGDTWTANPHDIAVWVLGLEK